MVLLEPLPGQAVIEMVASRIEDLAAQRFRQDSRKMALDGSPTEECFVGRRWWSALC